MSNDAVDPRLVPREIMVFANSGDQSLLFRIPMRSVDLDHLRSIYNRPANDPMYLIYDVGEKEAEQLKQYIDVEFDFTKYCYQLSTE